MKDGFTDKIVLIETLISFLSSLSCNSFIVAVRIILFSIDCMLPLLLALSSILIFSLFQSLYNLSYCSLVVLTVFVPFLPSVLLTLCSIQIPYKLCLISSDNFFLPSCFFTSSYSRILDSFNKSVFSCWIFEIAILEAKYQPTALH